MRTRLGKLSTQECVVKPCKHLVALDTSAIVEDDLGDPPANLGSDDHVLVNLKSSDSGQLVCRTSKGSLRRLDDNGSRSGRAWRGVVVSGRGPDRANDRHDRCRGKDSRSNANGDLPYDEACRSVTRGYGR